MKSSKTHKVGTYPRSRDVSADSQQEDIDNSRQALIGQENPRGSPNSLKKKKTKQSEMLPDINEQRYRTAQGGQFDMEILPDESMMGTNMIGETDAYHEQQTINSEDVENNKMDKSRRNSQVDETDDADQTMELNNDEILKLKLYKDKIKRNDLPMDRTRNFTERELKVPSDQAARCAKDNQKLFLDNFAIDIKIPTFFVLDSCLWPHDCDYMFQLVKYVFPTKKNAKTIQHLYNQQANVSSYKNIYGNTLSGNLVLRLMYKGEHTLEIKGETYLKDMQWAKFARSDDGRMFAFLTPEVDALNVVRNELRIYQCQGNDPSEILQHIEEKNYIYRYVEDEKNDKSLQFVKTLFWNQDGQKVIAWGDTRFFILDVIKGKDKFYSIQTDLYEKILSLTYEDGLDDIDADDECILVCKVQGKLQLIIYDFFQRRSQQVKGTLQLNKTLDEDLGGTKYSEKVIKRTQQMQARDFPIKVDFLNEPSQYFQVKWADKNDCLIFVDKHEMFVVEFMDDGYQRKRRLNHMIGKVVHFIYEDPTDTGFYILCSQEYDERLELEHTHRDEIFIDFETQVEPGIIKIFSMMIEEQPVEGDENQKRKKMTFLGMKDEEFTYDRCTYLETKKKHKEGSLSLSPHYYEQTEVQQLNEIYSQISSFTVSWPYIACSGMEDFLTVFNLNAPNYVHRVQLSPEGAPRMRINQTQITAANDIFAFTHQESTYKVFMIDLEAIDISTDPAKQNELMQNPESMFYQGKRKPVLEYTEEMVDNQPFVKMHCRGSSRKQPVDFDEKLMILMLHEFDLYLWVQLGYAKEQKAVRLRKIEVVALKYLRIESDNCLYIKTDGDLVGTGDEAGTSQEKIKQLNLGFCDYELTTVYTDSDIKDYIKAFNIDKIRQKIIIICESQSLQSKDNYYIFKIFDLEKQDMEFQLMINDEELIGRLLSGLYTFVDGHIYYNNNVIKIRYDLLSDLESTQLDEEKLFDRYINLFPLLENQTVRSNTPIDSYLSHRFAYIIQDRNLRDPRVIRLMPYLHERKVFLNEVAKNTSYFYTAVETSVASETMYNIWLHKKYPNIEPDDENEEDVQKNAKQVVVQDQEPLKTYTAFVCLCTMKRSFDVYMQNGKLINQVFFHDIVAKYGEPFAVSVDGLKFLFKKPESMILADNAKLNNTEKEMINSLMTIHIFKLSIFGFTHVKDIQIRKQVKLCLKDERDPSQPQFARFKIDNKWLFGRNFQEFKDSVKMEVRINNNMDICAKIQQIPSQGAYSGEPSTVYYFERCGLNLNREKIVQIQEEESYNISILEDLDKAILKGEEVDPITLEPKNVMNRVYYVKNHQTYNFQINCNNLFFHNRHKIQYFDFDNDFFEHNLKTIGLEVDKEETESQIKQVRMSSNDDIIMILMEESEGSVIFKWNMKTNFESHTADVSDLFKVLWDADGAMYLLSEGSVLFTNQKCRIKAFQFQELDKLKNNLKFTGLGAERGIRVDAKNHNWLILEEYLAIPFCYMSFVIKKFIEDSHELDDEVNKFDPEPYNYLLNKSTSFLDGNFVRTNPQELQVVLENFEKLDPTMLELLHYTQMVDVKEDTENVTETKEDEQEQLQMSVTKKISESFRQSVSQINSIKNKMMMIDTSPKIVQTRNSPLHMGVRDGNNKIVDIILLYMSKIDENASRFFKDIFDKLIVYKNMKDYINLLPMASNQMSKKQVLKCKYAESEDIIKMTDSNTIYVDTRFYREKMDEQKDNPNCSSFPVKVTALRVGWMLKSNSGPDGRPFLFEILKNEDLSFYNIESLRMIIEFLYQRIKVTIFYVQLPAFICNLILFVTLAIVNESTCNSFKVDETYVVGDDESNQYISSMIILLGIIFFTIILQTIINIYNFQKLGTDYLKRFWTIIDSLILINISYIIISYFFMVLTHIDPETNYFKMPYDDYKSQISQLRIQLMLGQMLLFAKSLQFLALIDSIAPLISITSQIVIDCIPFMIVLMIFVFTFSFGFFLLGKNQQYFDNIDEKDMNGLSYVTIVGAIFYICNMAIGNADTGPFNLGDANEAVLLQILFWLAIFIILILLLNMLIAIMGNTFTVGNESLEQQKYREHLRFVVDNWFLRELAFRNIKSVKYIVTAFCAADDEGSDKNFDEIKDVIAETSEKLSSQMKKQGEDIKDVRRMIIQLVKKDNPEG